MNIGQRIKSGEYIHTEFKTSFGEAAAIVLASFANATKIRRMVDKSVLCILIWEMKMLRVSLI